MAEQQGICNLTLAQLRLVAEAPVGRLATADDNATPHVIPVCFTIMDGCVYSVLDQKPKRAGLTRLRRVRNILQNPQASLVVDHYESDWDKLWYALLTGPALLLNPGFEQRLAVSALRGKYPQYLSMDIENNPVIKLQPEKAVFWGKS